jgi:hypothetical protein
VGATDTARDGLSSAVPFGGGVLLLMVDRSVFAAPVGDLFVARSRLQAPIAVTAHVAATTRRPGRITVSVCRKFWPSPGDWCQAPRSDLRAPPLPSSTPPPLTQITDQVAVPPWKYLPPALAVARCHASIMTSRGTRYRQHVCALASRGPVDYRFTARTSMNIGNLVHRS